ncbi:hypothetical protein [Dictyobacter aurantiacus]|uniref:Uncharacterized protein n=1 Tax=Dictyobacter aurantiacus TaxID=1936993 RepID=A0A401ZEK7_9CHLR|nr:hypothetical protein [Dictyobacter aurantiacus]GCE05311.1 hypothetical protein KDAU_26400 [Dictyobacter aurantiacus]
MAKTQIPDAPATSQNDTLKQRKKLAKKEAKLMLKVEQAKKDVRKVEKKIHKSQDDLKTRNERLHDLEGKLSHLQMSMPSTPDKAGKNDKADKNNKTNNKNKANKLSKGAEAGNVEQFAPSADNIQAIDSGDSYHNDTDVEAFHLSSLEPVEGGNELSDTTESTTNPSAEDVTIQSGEGSMPVETKDEHSWPPPLIREEVAQAIEEEAKNKPTVVEKHTQPSLEEPNQEDSDDHADTSPRHPTAHNIHTSDNQQAGEKDEEQAQDKSEDTPATNL